MVQEFVEVFTCRGKKNNWKRLQT